MLLTAVRWVDDALHHRDILAFHIDVQYPGKTDRLERLIVDEFDSEVGHKQIVTTGFNDSESAAEGS